MMTVTLTATAAADWSRGSISVSEAMKRYGWSRTTTHGYIRQRCFPVMRHGRMLRLPVANLEEFVESITVPAADRFEN